MRYRIRLATHARLERYAYHRRKTAGYIAREAVEKYSGENLGEYYAKCTRADSTMVSHPCEVPGGVRMDSLINWHIDQMPTIKEQSPITIDPEDLEQMIQIPRYTKAPYS